MSFSTGVLTVLLSSLLTGVPFLVSDKSLQKLQFPLLRRTGFVRTLLLIALLPTL